MKKIISLMLSIVMLISVISGVSLTAEAGSSFNSASQIQLGTSYTAYVTSNSNCYYKFTNQYSGKNTFSFTSYMEWVYFYIYDIDGNEIYESNPHWNNNTRLITFSLDLYLNSGTYYLAFVRDGDRTGSVNFSVGFQSANESFVEDFDGSNNYLANANRISLNTLYKGTVGKIDRVDYYRVELTNSGVVNWIVNSYNEWVYLYIYDINGNEIYEKNPHWNSNTKKITFNENIFLTSGTYYIGVVEDGNHPGFYDFRLNFTSSNESFKETNGGTNNSLSTANNIAINTTYNGHLGINDNEDIYRISLSTGSYKLNLKAKAEWIYIYVYDSNGNEIYNKNPHWNSNTKEITLNDVLTLNSGTYYIGVFRDGQRNCNYSFSLGKNIVVAVPSTLKVSSRGINALKLTWGKASGVSGYELQMKSGSAYKTVATTTATSYTVKNLAAGKSYAFRVRAYKYVDGKKYYGSFRTLTAPTKPATPTIKTPTTNKKHQLIAKWSTVASCTGYQVQFCKNKSCSSVISTRTVSGKTKSSYTGNNFTKGKTYYIRVRSYLTVNGTNYYGNWSAVKAIKCK